MDEESRARIAAFAERVKAAQAEVARKEAETEAKARAELARFDELLEGVVTPALEDVVETLKSAGMSAYIDKVNPKWVHGKHGGCSLAFPGILTHDHRPSSLSFGYDSVHRRVAMAARVPGMSGPRRQPIPLDEVTTKRITDEVTAWLDSWMRPR